MFRILIIILFLQIHNVVIAGVKQSNASDSLSAADSVKIYRLSIESNLENARVYFDTTFAGFTPLENYEVKEGQYEIKIFNPKSLKDWEGENEIIDIYVDRDTTLDVSFRYFYYFNTTPFDAEVFGGDSLLGSTPLRLFRENTLTGTLLFKKKNYKDYLYDIKDYDFETGANIVLQSKGKESINDVVYKDRITQFKTKRSLVTIGALLAASITTGYFAINYKSKANEEYAKYLITGNQATLDNSKNNDTYFVISLVLMQAAIGGLIYFLFFDK
ncbi:MAG: PEGA domain-containing protein [Ignavibacteria bacterium]